MSFKAGITLQGGRYIIESTLGKGGFGLTYRALHAPLGLTVVIKTLQERLRRSPQYPRFRSQLVTEAQTLSQFQHPSIVRVIDLFEEDQYPCVVMEYIPGLTLAALAKPGQPLDESFAVYYIRQVATALSVIHAKGFVHRDVKPKNVLRREGNRRAVLIDFGIAQTPDPNQAPTRALSANYAPPEQYHAGSQLTPAADIYALSATLYYLLAGQPPIPALRRERTRLPSLQTFQPNLTPGLEQAILQGMTLDVSKRPQSVQEWLGLIPRNVPNPVLGESSTHAVTTIPPRSPQQVNRPDSRRSRSSQPPKPSSATEPDTTAIAPPSRPASVGAETRDANPTKPIQKKRTVASGVILARSQASVSLPRKLVSTATLAALIGGGIALVLRFTPSPNKPLIEMEQAFPSNRPWPGGLPTPFEQPANAELPTPAPENDADSSVAQP